MKNITLYKTRQALLQSRCLLLRYSTDNPHNKKKLANPLNTRIDYVSITRVNTSIIRSVTTVIKPMLALAIFGFSVVSVQAEIITDSSERRVQVRSSTGTGYISKAVPKVINDTGMQIVSRNEFKGDTMQGLIEQKQREFDFDAKLSIDENKRVHVNKRPPAYNTIYNTTSDPVYNTNNNTALDFNGWLNRDRYRSQQVASFQRYLNTQLGANNVPPMSELLTTARSWEKCGYEPYQLPPQELWSNIVPTLRLYSNLKNQGVLPRSAEIRSVYRSPDLNACAGGANSSKHMTAGAIDIWVPEYDSNLWARSSMQDGLCEFWQYQGQIYSFGLGLYSTGAIHLDTQGYRKWGFDHASSNSPCRY